MSAEEFSCDVCEDWQYCTPGYGCRWKEGCGHVDRLVAAILEEINAEITRIEALNTYVEGAGLLWQYRGGLSVAASIVTNAPARVKS